MFFECAMTKIEMDIDPELVETFKENKGELSAQFVKLIERFRTQIVKSEDINTQYQYEDIDIQAILVSRIKQLVSEDNQIFSKPVHILGAVDNIIDTNIVYRQLEQRLQQDQNEYKGKKVQERIILIPCNLGLSHWVGLLVEFQTNGEIARAEYIDPLKATTTVPESLQRQWDIVYKDCTLYIKELLKQNDITSCGAYTIENLLQSARNPGKLGKNMEAKKIRQLHLQCLKEHNFEFYQGFYERQKNNKQTTATLYEQLGYLNKEILFSYQEINRILELKKHLTSISDQSVKESLRKALQPGKEYKDNTGAHLNAIRDALQKITVKCLTSSDQKAFQAIIKMFFGIEYYLEAPLNLKGSHFQLDYEEILAVAQQTITLEAIDDMQKQINKQIKEDEELARKLQAELWHELSKQMPQSTLKRTHSESSKESQLKRVHSEGSEYSDNSSFRKILGFSPIFSTPARNSSKRDSGASALLTTTAVTERHILLSYILSEGKISIIINSGQRPNTAISGSQGDHVTAYTTLLQTLCSVVDGEDMHEAPNMLYEAAKCFISDPGRLKEFDKLFAKKQQEIERQFFPREVRKSLTYNLREINKYAKSIISSVKDQDLKKSLRFLTNNNKPDGVDVDLLRDTIKHSNQALFAQFVVEVGNQLLKDYNKEETAALPKINVDRDVREGNRVKHAMKILRLLNKLVGFKQELSVVSNIDKKKMVEEFKIICKSIIETSFPNIKQESKFNEHFSKFLLDLGLIRQKNLYINFNNIEKHINEIEFSKVKFEIVGRLFNDLFDFNQKNVRQSEEGESNGDIIDGKIVFEDPENILYEVISRHIRFMFIAFKNLDILDKQYKEKIIKGFLELVVKNPQRNDNSQGWCNYELRYKNRTVKLTVGIIYDNIKNDLSKFFIENTKFSYKHLKLKFR